MTWLPWGNKPVQEPPRPISIVKACEHKWKDFDWYLPTNIEKISQYKYVLRYSMVEPYVCIHCHERKNITLESSSITFAGQDAYRDLNKFIESLTQRYPKIKDRAVVEDAVNDEQLVDREYIRIAEWLRGTGQLKKDGDGFALSK